MGKAAQEGLNDVNLVCLEIRVPSEAEFWGNNQPTANTDRPPPTTLDWARNAPSQVVVTLLGF